MMARGSLDCCVRSFWPRAQLPLGEHVFLRSVVLSLERMMRVPKDGCALVYSKSKGDGGGGGGHALAGDSQHHMPSSFSRRAQKTSGGRNNAIRP